VIGIKVWVFKGEMMAQNAEPAAPAEPAPPKRPRRAGAKNASTK
jgi:Ribosomal protein S3